jgi:hypothetical protein
MIGLIFVARKGGDHASFFVAWLTAISTSIELTSETTSNDGMAK